MKNKIKSQVLKEIKKEMNKKYVVWEYNDNDMKKAISRTIELMENEQKPFIKKLGKSAVEWMRGYNQLEDDCKKFWAKNIELNKRNKNLHNENIQLNEEILRIKKEQKSNFQKMILKADWTDFSKDDLMEEYSEETQTDDFHDNLFNEFIANKILAKLNDNSPSHLSEVGNTPEDNKRLRETSGTCICGLSDIKKGFDSYVECDYCKSKKYEEAKE